MTRGIQPQIDVLAVGATATLATLLAAAGGAWRVDAHKTTLIPHAVGIYMDDGVATAADHPMGVDNYVIDGGQPEAAGLQFFAAVATNMTIIQS